MFCYFLAFLLCSSYSVGIKICVFFAFICLYVYWFKLLQKFVIKHVNYFHKVNGAATTTSSYYGSLDWCREKIVLQLAMKEARKVIANRCGRFHTWLNNSVLFSMLCQLLSLLLLLQLFHCLCLPISIEAFQPSGSSLFLLFLCISNVFIFDLVEIMKVSATRAGGLLLLS